MPTQGATDSSPSPEPRFPLSKDRVLRAAIALADQGGIDALSMRKLAQELGVEAMSLYHHVAGKDEILNGIVEIVESDIELPDRGTDWKPALRRTAISAHDVFERHPWAASLTLSVTGRRPARWRYMNGILGCLREAGFTAEMTDLAYHALESHIAGFTLWSSQIDVDDEDLPGLAADFISSLPADELPYVVEHVDQHLQERSSEQQGAFAFGLDLILDGLERILENGDQAGSRTQKRVPPPLRGSNPSVP
ncbi:MAG TPA: TetR/AcrR family transcriptional regulator C-terminal domain-containing protein [Candidatus Limnocylindrales bacterium]|nr:TetR/AcrR family transcriptional regulator C-terminal domain-containing protein [Candidatus Limnocylindrales bacterium]